MNDPNAKPASLEPDQSTIGFTNEEVERRALEAARRMLATPKPGKDQQKVGKVKGEPKPLPAPKLRNGDEQT